MPDFSYYKGHPLRRGQKPCLLCQTATRGQTQRVVLGYGEHVWLCEQHAAPAFRTQRGGRDFLLSIGLASDAAGVATRRRSLAIRRFVAAATDPPAGVRPRPGSYAWPELRRAVEESCRRGRSATSQLVALVAAALKGATKTGWVCTPSLRTLRRWRAERRWEAAGWSPPARMPRG